MVGKVLKCNWMDWGFFWKLQRCALANIFITRCSYETRHLSKRTIHCLNVCFIHIAQWYTCITLLDILSALYTRYWYCEALPFFVLVLINIWTVVLFVLVGIHYMYKFFACTLNLCCACFYICLHWFIVCFRCLN